jgi:hypothetical protein
MSKEMSTIRSTLIKTCVNNVQKELGQLEHWLHILPDDISNSSNTINLNTSNSNYTTNNYTNDINSIKNSITVISNNINKLVDTTNRQQMLIDSINARLHHIENIRTIRVDDPWTDNHIVPLQNEIVNLCVNTTTNNDDSDSDSDSDNESSCVYCVNKQEVDDSDDDSESAASIHPLLKTPELQPNIPDDMSDVPDINDDTYCDENKQSNVIEQKEDNIIVLEAKVVVEQKVEVQEETVEEEEEQQEETVEVEEEEQQEETVEVEEEEEQQEETVEEEEEEEGLELEEIDFKGVKYYKDGEGFIYSINEEDEPSENPIGYWKEKTQTIAFYKLK